MPYKRSLLHPLLGRLYKEIIKILNPHSTETFPSQPIIPSDENFADAFDQFDDGPKTSGLKDVSSSRNEDDGIVVNEYVSNSDSLALLL